MLKKKSSFPLNFKNKIFLLISINLIIKFPLIFIYFEPSDIYFYWSAGQLLLNGYIPYIDFSQLDLYNPIINLNSNHPNGPMNYYLYSLFEIVLGKNGSPFSIKFPMFIAELISTLMIFLIGKEILNEKKSFFISLFYTICPISYLPMLLFGCDEIISGMFTLTSLYLFIKNKKFLSGIFISFSIFYKYYSIFFLIPLIICMFIEKEFKFLIKFILSLLITSFCLCFPFIFLSFNDFFYWTIIQINRFQTISIGEILSNTFLYKIIINFEVVSIKIINLIQLLVITISTLYIYHSFSINKLNETLSNKKKYMLIMKFCAFFSIILPILSLSLNYRYFFWALPFFLLIMFQNVDFHENYLQNFGRYLFIMNILLIILISYNLKFTITPYNIHVLQLNGDVFNFIFYFFYSIWGFYFFIILRQRFERFFIIGLVLNGISTQLVYTFSKTPIESKFLNIENYKEIYLLAFLLQLISLLFLALSYILNNNKKNFYKFA